jgi:hypothetical protein
LNRTRSHAGLPAFASSNASTVSRFNRYDERCREGESPGLRWSRVDSDAGTLAVCRTLSGITTGYVFETPKNSKGRSVLLALIRLTNRASYSPCSDEHSARFPRVPRAHARARALRKPSKRRSETPRGRRVRLGCVHQRDSLGFPSQPAVVVEGLQHERQAKAEHGAQPGRQEAVP